MAELEAIQVRHSVQQYLNKPLKPDELSAVIALGHAFYVKMDLGKRIFNGDDT
ncbi:MAG: hypothetical protein K2M42_10855 [Oscillospiraceae bacterium]|nr:hypothetical protein [Oscillospiraceae bacterium]